MSSRQKRSADSPDGPRLVKRVCRHPHHRPASPILEPSVAGPDAGTADSISLDAPSTSSTSVASARYDLSVVADSHSVPPLSKFAPRRPRPKRAPSPAASTATGSATANVAATERRRLLPRLDTTNLQLQPSPVSCASPAASTSTYVPLHVPPIRRETLRELDLEAILGNVQLRHDLLFDPGLQFRPLTSRRKRTAADRYWTAIQRELETGCTCTSFDEQGRLLPCMRTSVNPLGIAWGRPRDPDALMSPSPSPPSRIPALIAELREVMLSVMVPSPLPPPCCSTESLCSASEKVSDAFATSAMQVSARMVIMALNSVKGTEDVPMESPPSPTEAAASPVLSTPTTLVSPLPLAPAPAARLTRIPVVHPQLSAQTSFQHSQVRAALDVPLIVQQITHGVFNPAELFSFIGQLIKFHCAPMRDAAVEDVVTTAKLACAEISANAQGVSSSGSISSCMTSSSSNSQQNLNLGKVVLAIRKCFDLFEVMKLDIANHQLQFLRKYLFRTAKDCELDALYDRQLRGVVNLDLTRQWISRHVASSSRRLTTGSANSGAGEPKTTTTDRALCEGIIDLIFDPPRSTPAAAASFASQVFLPPPSPIGSSSSHVGVGASENTFHHRERQHQHHHQQPQQAPTGPAPTGYPETLWLDHTRLSVLSTDAADLTAVYMMLMLYRQSVHSSQSSASSVPVAGMGSGAGNAAPPAPGAAKIQIRDWELGRVKREIWQVGPQRLGWCFFRGGFGALPIVDTNINSNRSGSTSSAPSNSTGTAAATATSGTNAAHTATAATASGNGNGAGGGGSEEEEAIWRRGIKDVILQVAARARETASGANASFPSESDASSSLLSSSTSSSLVLPDPQTVKLLEGWMVSNMAEGSSMHELLRKRLRAALLDVVLGLVLPSSSSSPSATSIPSTIAGTGLEPLMPEIQAMADRISKLVSLHSHVYRHVYDTPGFILHG